MKNKCASMVFMTPKVHRSAMITRLVVTITLLGGFLSFTQGCTTGKRPFLMVQLCLQNQQGVHLFKDVMRDITNSEHMTFVDRSETTQGELTELKAAPPFQVVHLIGYRADGTGWSAGNIGLSAYEVAMGFSQGSNPKEARNFANMTIARLEKEWHVYTVPEGQGAVSLEICK